MELISAYVVEFLLTLCFFGALGIGYAALYRSSGYLDLLMAGQFAVAQYLTYLVAVRLGAPLWLGILAALAGSVALGVVGYAYGRVVRSPFGVVLGTFGIGMVAVHASVLIWGYDALIIGKAAPLQGSVSLLGLRLQEFDVAVILLFVATFTAAMLVLTFTEVGTQLRAVVDNRELARALGLPAAELALVGYVFNASILAFGAAFQTLKAGVPVGGSGLEVLVAVLVVVLISGRRALAGVAVGAVVVATLDTIVFAVWGLEWRTLTSLLLVLGVLVLRPSGLLRGDIVSLRWAGRGRTRHSAAQVG